MNSKWDKLKEKQIETNYSQVVETQREKFENREKQLAMYIRSLKRLTADLF